MIIPAYNEEDNIDVTVKTVKNIKEVEEIIVVDDGSKDKTAEKARKAGAEVVSHIKNMGKAQALNTGIKAAKGDIIVFLDADIRDTAEEIRNLIIPVKTGEADMTIAQLPSVKTKGGLGLVKKLAALGVYAFTGTSYKSCLSGQRAVNRKIIEEIGDLGVGFGAEVIMTIRAINKGFKVKEIPVAMNHRVTGRNIKDFIHRGKQFLEIFKSLLREINN